jgi:hypothetical protein
MIPTLTGLRQYLAAALLLVIGLMAYGCGDSATVNPVVELASLTVSPGSLQPGFSGGTTQYRVDVTTDTETVSVTAQPAVSGDSVTINGQATTSRTITLEPAGETTIVNVVVSETDTNSRTYVIRVVRAGLAGNNSLQNLTVSQGTLAPTFDANLLSYTVSVTNTVGSINVTPTLSDPAATMTVNGEPATSGQARRIDLNLAGQSTTITILVKAQNGTEKPYTITVSRGVSNNNNLRGLTISGNSTLTLNPRFSAGTLGYTVNVANSVGSVRVTPTLQDTTATMTVNTQATTSGQARTITLNTAGSNTFINIFVIAQDGRTSKTYSVEVRRAALGGNNDLRSLTVSQPGLTPAFRADTTGYTLDVGTSIGSIIVTAAPEDPNATLTVTSNGQVTGSGQARTITLRGAGLSTTINIAVRAQNNSLNTYVITVDRAASPPPSGNNNLRNLTVSPGTLSPTFTAARTLPYAVNDISSSATAINVTATPQDQNARVTINGQGGNSRSIPLPTGPSRTDIEVLVIAPNDSDRTYLITVNQPAPAEPPAPTDAPDLIPADDSCLPTSSTDPTCDPGSGTTREDNVTNVTSPGFTVTAPPAGTTPKLYIDGVKDVNSTFAQGTLRPSTPFDNGTYTITYTLTNAGGESNQSPPMDPPLQINTIPPQQ